MDERTEQMIECNVCHSRKNELKKKGVFGSPDQDVYKCKECGHLYLAPLLSDEDEGNFYANEYPSFLLKRGDVKNSDPETHFLKNKDEAARRYADIGYLFHPGQVALEIGSATGFFLDHIRNSVSSVYGVEPNEAHRSCANKKGISTHPTLEALPVKKFDIIFLYYVLEHVKDPVNFLRYTASFLRDKNSKIVLEVPNLDEALVSLYRSPAYDRFVWQKAHCSYFSPGVLKRVIGEAGLEPELKPVQRYDLSNHIYWLAAGEPGGTGKYDHIFSGSLVSQYKEDLKKAWLCDSILAIAGLK